MSSLPPSLQKNRESATVRILDCIADGKICPIFNKEIIREYSDVLTREKFKFNKQAVKELIEAIFDLGILMDKTTFPDDMPDPKDRVFYEVSLTRESYLVTGNKKHFPQTPKVVTPAEMLTIIGI